MADNKATPKLLFAYLNQSNIETVTFSAAKGTMLSASGNDYLTVTLSDVNVTSYFHASNKEFNMIPVVEASLSFSKIRMEYKEADKTYSTGWDFVTNTPVT